MKTDPDYKVFQVWPFVTGMLHLFTCYGLWSAYLHLLQPTESQMESERYSELDQLHAMCVYITCFCTAASKFLGYMYRHCKRQCKTCICLYCFGTVGKIYAIGYMCADWFDRLVTRISVSYHLLVGLFTLLLHMGYLDMLKPDMDLTSIFFVSASVQTVLSLPEVASTFSQLLAVIVCTVTCSCCSAPDKTIRDLRKPLNGLV